MKNEKAFEYGALIVEAIQEMIEENGLNDQLNEGKNLTHFIHAAANLAPNIIYQYFTGHNANNLEFNHIANSLCFQYSSREGEEK